MCSYKWALNKIQGVRLFCLKCLDLQSFDRRQDRYYFKLQTRDASSVVLSYQKLRPLEGPTFSLYEGWGSLAQMFLNYLLLFGAILAIKVAFCKLPRRVIKLSKINLGWHKNTTLFWFNSLFLWHFRKSIKN